MATENPELDATEIDVSGIGPFGDTPVPVTQFPDCTMDFDPVVMTQRLTRAAFIPLMRLDMKKAVAVIMGEEAGNFDEDKPDEYPDLEVTVRVKNDVPVLSFAFDTCGGELFLEADPAKFDRTRPEENEMFLRCATLIKAIHESPLGDDTPDGCDDYGHPCCLPFTFKKHTFDEKDEEMARAWAKLAEIWAAASAQTT